MSDVTDRIHLPQQVSDHDRAHAATLMEAMDQAQKELAAFPAPTCGTRFDLFPGDSPSDYDSVDEMPLALVCPWCGKDITADALFDLEVSFRHTYAETIDSDEQTVAFDYDGDADYDSVVYVHELCNLPVDVPEGWEWVSS